MTSKFLCDIPHKLQAKSMCGELRTNLSGLPSDCCTPRRIWSSKIEYPSRTRLQDFFPHIAQPWVICIARTIFLLRKLVIENRYAWNGPASEVVIFFHLREVKSVGYKYSVAALVPLRQPIHLYQRPSFRINTNFLTKKQKQSPEAIESSDHSPCHPSVKSSRSCACWRSSFTSQPRPRVMWAEIGSF